MQRTADVIVIGLGAMGSATAGSLAANGHRVLAFDRFTPPHSQGSSHGQSRIFRQAYFEDPRYVPMLLRTRELWEKLERDSGRQLLHFAGALNIAHRGNHLAQRSIESARRFNLPHEVISGEEFARRWPVFHAGPDTIALFDPNAGYVVPEICVEALLQQAAQSGADLHYGEPVLEWQAGPESVTVRTALGAYVAARLVITAGPWAPQVLADLGLPMCVTRQIVFWFEPKNSIDLYRSDRMPVYLFDSQGNEPIVYGFPLTGPDSDGVKVALHGSTELCTPENVHREMRAEDERLIRSRLDGTLPQLAGRLLHSQVCLYTMTPDEHFIIGPHPRHASVTIAAGFSGHGFKFAPVIGEIAGGLATSGTSSFDLEMFSPTRFASMEAAT